MNRHLRVNYRHFGSVNRSRHQADGGQPRPGRHLRRLLQRLQHQGPRGEQDQADSGALDGGHTRPGRDLDGREDGPFNRRERD